MDLLFSTIFFLFLFVGLFVILTNNPVHSILALVLIFFLSACLSLSLGVEFLALLILIVYVGAISVLFLFTVMLLNIRVLELNISLIKYWWLGVLYCLFFVLNLLYAVWPLFLVNNNSTVVYVDLLNHTREWNTVSQFGELIFLYFPHMLLIAALILFVAIVSPVLLTFITFNAHIDTADRDVALKQDIFTQTLRLSVDKNFISSFEF